MREVPLYGLAGEQPERPLLAVDRCVADDHLHRRGWGLGVYASAFLVYRGFSITKKLQPSFDIHLHAYMKIYTYIYIYKYIYIYTYIYLYICRERTRERSERSGRSGREGETSVSLLRIWPSASPMQTVRE